MKAPGANIRVPKPEPTSRILRPLEIWRFTLFYSLLVGACLLFTGCVSKAKAKLQAREAFVAGQQQALARMPQTQNGPIVTVIGPVTNGNVPWTEDLTVAKAIVAAGYVGKTDPREIVLVRAGRGLQIDPKLLLAGEDQSVQPGDIIQLNP